MTEPNGSFERHSRHVTLTDGTPAVIRPIRADGGAKLTQALERLSPESRYQRFLHDKCTFSPSELNYLTSCDGLTHIALVLVTTDEANNEIEPVGVARCIRDAHDGALAEVAIVVADEWQGKGVGKHLYRALAEECGAVGIERWQALLRVSNIAAFRLMDTVGTRQAERPEYIGTLTVTYQLNPAFTSLFNGKPSLRPAVTPAKSETDALLKSLSSSPRRKNSPF